MDNLTLAQNFAVWVLPVLFAITVHEVAHGWMARQLGDNTAFMLGRLTLNPLRHIDPVGTLLVPGLMLAFSGMVFGWAKPVPVNWRNLHNLRRDMCLVALAGPLSNLLMAIMWAFLAKFGSGMESSYIGEPLTWMGLAGIQINLVLFLVNLLPIPPLDGGRVLDSLLPPALSNQYRQLEPYGLVIMVALLYFGILGKILTPMLRFFMHWVLSLVS